MVTGPSEAGDRTAGRNGGWAPALIEPEQMVKKNKGLFASLGHPVPSKAAVFLAVGFTHR